MARSKPKYKYEVRQIEAWTTEEGGWTWNESWHMGFMFTHSDDVDRALTYYLKAKHKIIFKKGRTLIESDGSVYEIIDRKTKEPLFAAIRMEENHNG